MKITELGTKGKDRKVGAVAYNYLDLREVAPDIEVTEELINQMQSLTSITKDEKDENDALLGLKPTMTIITQKEWDSMYKDHKIKMAIMRFIDSTKTKIPKELFNLLPDHISEKLVAWAGLKKAFMLYEEEKNVALKEEYNEKERLGLNYRLDSNGKKKHIPFRLFKLPLLDPFENPEATKYEYLSSSSEKILSVFKNIDFSLVTFDNVTLFRCLFINCKMPKVIKNGDFLFSRFLNCEFDKSEITSSDFAMSSMRLCTFNKCKMNERVDLSGINFKGTTITDCDMERVAFYQSVFDKYTKPNVVSNNKFRFCRLNLILKMNQLNVFNNEFIGCEKFGLYDESVSKKKYKHLRIDANRTMEKTPLNKGTGEGPMSAFSASKLTKQKSKPETKPKKVLKTFTRVLKGLKLVDGELVVEYVRKVSIRRSILGR